MALFVLPVLSTAKQPTFVDLVVASVSDNNMQIVQFVVCQLMKSKHHVKVGKAGSPKTGLVTPKL